MKDFVIIFFALALCALLLSASVLYPRTPAPLGAVDGPIFTMQRAAAVSVTTTSTQVAATSTSRRYLLIQNDSSTKAYCNTDGRAGIDQTGFSIAASSSYETYGERLYAGAINCIASSTVKMLVSEAY
jgi:hypothetical protein